jgi:hypothetical protein
MTLACRSAPLDVPQTILVSAGDRRLPAQPNSGPSTQKQNPAAASKFCGSSFVGNSQCGLFCADPERNNVTYFVDGIARRHV